MRFDGKVALMTACGSGIGRAVARAFGRKGAKVVVNDINAEGAAATAAMIHDEGGTADVFVADMSDADLVAELVQFTVAEHGRLDILLNNAAYLDFRGMLPLADLPVEIWDRSIAVGLRSYFLASKYAIPEMIKGGGGVILNTASVGGLEGAHRYSHYCSVKAAVINLTRNIALDYSRSGIRAVAICPGSIVTEAIEASFPDEDHPFRKLRQNMIPLGRMGRTDDIANAAVFLASERASFITGVAIPVDGGMTAGKFIPDFDEIMTAMRPDVG